MHNLSSFSAGSFASNSFRCLRSKNNSQQEAASIIAQGSNNGGVV